MKKIFSKIIRLATILWEIPYLFLLIILSLLSRFIPRSIDVGLGPDPLINNVYHKKALELYNYNAETFVDCVYFITDEFDKKFIYKNKYFAFLFHNVLHSEYVVAIFRYKCLYFYFHGGPLRRSSILWRFEPFLYKLANVKIVVMPYGSDIQVLDRTPNLYFKHTMITDYPSHRFNHSKIQAKIKLWSSNADCVISGCEWVDYMYHWDRLMVAHFSIDADDLIQKNTSISELENKSDVFKILHAPNHRSIKGTKFVIDAVEELKSQGYEIELIIAEGRPNSEIIELINRSDLIIDQLVIGWYAMFAIESMVRNKTVVCYMREDLLRLYQYAGLIEEDEPPMINANPSTLKNVISDCINGRINYREIGMKGGDYINKVHSIESVGKVFDEINRSIGLTPKYNDHFH